jgi:hypothetical protein
MRYLFLFIATVLVLTASPAQVSVQFHVNLGSQPVWGPTGYDYAQYYYFPDIETYYDVSHQRFYYNDGRRWVGRSQLPARYHDFDLYNSYKVVVNDRNPYLRHAKYRDQYASFRGRHDQQPIRDSRDAKYFVIKDHPEHGNWVKQHHDNGNDKNRGKGRGNSQNGNKGNGKRGN